MLSMKWYLSMAQYFKDAPFVTLGKGQFKVKVKIESEKHIYIIPANTPTIF